MAIRAGTTFLLVPREERPRGYDDKLLKAFAQHRTSAASVDVDSSSSDAKKLSSVITLCMVTLQKAAAQSCFVYSVKSRNRRQRENSERWCEEGNSLDHTKYEVRTLGAHVGVREQSIKPKPPGI